MGLMKQAASAVAGAGLGWASGEAARRLGGRAETAGIGGGLVVAALIYPAARRRLGSGGIATELATVAATTAIAATAHRLDGASARRVLAAGWASHSVFDLLRGPSDDSRLPSTYPALCAGYDLALAAHLAR